MKVYETDSTEAAATRKNDYFFRDWDPDPASKASDYPEINVKEGGAVTSKGKAWIPGVSETPITYDANGNLTGDAQWSYTYDEENRLIKMTETSAAATAGFPDTTITFKYDYLSRRVEKKVVRGTTTVSHLRFVWRGWMLVAELNAASDNARIKTYTWGPDVSGSFGGAGGNGGVLVFKDHTSSVNESFYPAYDAQGNVTGLIDTSGNLDAAYEYDPFGKLIRHAGARRACMSLLYGTKYTDMETGLIYYGHRYYDPRQGRFINRDPIEEEGGLNLYRFVSNNPVNGLDFLGLCESEGDVDPETGEEICHDEINDEFNQELKNRALQNAIGRAGGLTNWILDGARMTDDDYLAVLRDTYDAVSDKITGQSDIQPWPIRPLNRLGELAMRTYVNLTGWHYETRDANNPANLTYEEVIDRNKGWRLMTPEESILHDNKVGRPELKFNHPDGGEFVFSADDTGEYQLYTHPMYMGTFNYIPPAPKGDGWTDVAGWSNWFVYGSGHFVVDVVPYLIGGNVRGPDDDAPEEDDDDDDDD